MDTRDHALEGDSSQSVGFAQRDEIVHGRVLPTFVEVVVLRVEVIKQVLVIFAVLPSPNNAKVSLC